MNYEIYFMEPEKKENSNGCAISIIASLLIGSWGFKSWMYGDGFMTGIGSNFAVLPILIIIGIVVIIFVAISNK